MVLQVCDNALDDDGDGLVDCEQVDCFGPSSCPYFTVHLDSGHFERRSYFRGTWFNQRYLVASSVRGHVVAATSGGETGACSFVMDWVSWHGSFMEAHHGMDGTGSMVDSGCGLALEDVFPHWFHVFGSSPFIAYHAFPSPWWAPESGWVSEPEYGWFSHRSFVGSYDTIDRTTWRSGRLGNRAYFYSLTGSSNPVWGR